MMKPPIEDMSQLPGQSPVTWRKPAALWTPLACVIGVFWPPALVTLAFWWPRNWFAWLDTDPRLIGMLLAAIGIPIGVWLLAKERERTGRPATKLGLIWRFLLYGGLYAAALQILLVLTMIVLGWGEAGTVAQSLGASETTLLIGGVLGLPVAILIGVSYALWAGFCIALIAFEKRPPKVRDRLGLMRDQ